MPEACSNPPKGMQGWKMMHEDPDNTRVLREMPPRHLNWYTRLVVLFGDYTMQAGWFLLAFGCCPRLAD